MIRNIPLFGDDVPKLHEQNQIQKLISTQKLFWENRTLSCGGFNIENLPLINPVSNIN